MASTPLSASSTVIAVRLAPATPTTWGWGIAPLPATATAPAATVAASSSATAALDSHVRKIRWTDAAGVEVAEGHELLL